MHDDLLLEALVDQGLLDGLAGVLGNLVSQGDARGVVVRVRGEDDHRDDQTEHIHGQSALANVMSATAINLIRVDAWLNNTPLGTTRLSHLARLNLAA